MASNEPEPTDCFLCSKPFREGDTLTKDHVIPKRWFSTPPPPQLPTLQAHFECNNGLSASEERVRNLLARSFGHNPDAFAQVLDKASRSRQPFPAGESVDFTTAAGEVVPASLVAFDPSDLHAVFRKITRGLFFKEFGRQMADGPVRVSALPQNIAGPLSAFFINELKVPIQRRGEFSWMRANEPETPDAAMWLFMVFAAGIVQVNTGAEMVSLPAPSATGVAVRPPR